MSMNIDPPSGWVCDGRELKPKSGASSSNTWVFVQQDYVTLSEAS